ncbi:hypothetical protein ABTM19_19915, partial [Acinetobacter baumannii]
LLASDRASLPPLLELGDVPIELAAVLGEIVAAPGLQVRRQLGDRLGGLSEPLGPGVGALRRRWRSAALARRRGGLR